MKLIDKYLKKGYSLEEAQVKVHQIVVNRSKSLKANWLDPVKRKEMIEKRKVSLVPKLRGKKRTDEQKKKIKENTIKSIERRKKNNIGEWEAKYKKMNQTNSNKTVEEKERIKKKRVNSFKNWWKDKKNKDQIIKRNRKISKASLGKVRSEESKRKQALTNTGKKQSEATKLKRVETRKKKLEKGETLGVRCKVFNVNGLFCQGTFEKKYIENLIKDNEELPENGNYYTTPFGIYQADFEFPDRIVEIKSEFTYSIFNGKSPNIDGHYNEKQKSKIKWVGENIKPVQLLVFNIKGVLQKEEWYTTKGVEVFYLTNNFKE